MYHSMCMLTHPGLTRSTQKESQFRLGDSLHDLRLRRLCGTRRRNTEVLRLVDVGAAGPRVEGWDESQELTLQYKLVVPSSSALCAARSVLIVIFFLKTQ